MTFIALLLYLIPVLTLLTVDVRKNSEPLSLPLRVAVAVCWPAFCVFAIMGVTFGWDKTEETR